MLRRALLVAACVFPVVAGPAAAQLQPWPDQPQQQAPAASPWDQKEPPCLKAFGILRDDAQKKAGAIQAASKRKATPKEACGLFNAFAAAEVKMIKYATNNAAGCGIPPEIVASLKKGHEQNERITHQGLPSRRRAGAGHDAEPERRARLECHPGRQQHQDRPRHLRHPDRHPARQQMSEICK